MTSSCWKLVGIPAFGSVEITEYFCGQDEASTTAGYPHYVVSGAFYSFNRWDSVTYTKVPRSYCVNCGPPDPLTPSQKHDCVNGYCLPSATYGTPGIFANLAACESGCAKNSNCTGECVSADELAALQQAANNLKARLCG
jgi:hypothetical protein